MHEGLIDSAVASSATYRDARGKKEEREGGVERDSGKIVGHNGHDITIGITRAEK